MFYWSDVTDVPAMTIYENDNDKKMMTVIKMTFDVVTDVYKL